MNGAAMAVDTGAGGNVKPFTGRGVDTLLICAPVPLYARPDGTLLMEEQACNGLRLWAENFERLIVMMPLESRPAPPNWVPLSTLGTVLDRIEVHALPSAYRSERFFHNCPNADGVFAT